MEILSVTLKNFKVHGDRYFQFQPGTNAICGENGAGKSSILEAIAWTLFNYRGNYRKEDFIRNGCRSAQSTVSFISNRDQRTYNVQRCTSKGYTLFDPQLNQRLPYNRIDDEILPWLREHLGVTAGTDLPRLFENTIGVPQGMITADFLLSGEKRRRVFDAILKVEEYKQTATGLGVLQKYADGQVDGVERDLAHYDEILSDRADIESQHVALAQDTQDSEAKLAALEQTVAQLTQQKEQWETKAQAIKALEQKVHTLSAQIEGRQREQQLWSDAVMRSQQAVQLCEQHQPGYEQYLAADTALKVLQEQRQRYTQLLHQRQQLEQQGAEVERELATLSERLRQITIAEERIQSLTPLLAQQTDLEQKKQTLDTIILQCQQWNAEQEAAQKHLHRLRTDWKERSQVIKRIKTYETQIETIPLLEGQRDRLQLQLSRVEVAKQFESELQEIVAQAQTDGERHHQIMQSTIAQLQQLRSIVTEPNQALLESVLLNLNTDTNLTQSVTQQLQKILRDISGQASVNDLQHQHQTISLQLQRLYQQRGEWDTLAERQEQLTAIQQEGSTTQSHIDQLTQQLDEQSGIQKRLSEVVESLKTLGDPCQQQKILQQELSQKPCIMEQQEQLLPKQQQGQIALVDLNQQLQEFTDLEALSQQQQQLQATHHPSYLIVLQNQQGAEQLSDNQDALSQVEAAIANLKDQQMKLKTEYEAAVADYDPQAAQEVSMTYQQVHSQMDQLRGRLPQQKLQLTALAERLEQFKAVAKERDRAATELTPKKEAQDFIAFARNIYKQAGPRITERYIQAISAEADRLFRELVNRQNVSLSWTRDYDIVVQEGPHPRRFVNLSGGEQMCAALAVRLALLRVLADIDIAFFDEPTTNMDRARRERLAEAIANLRTFHQLFVISHDDTFEQFTEHVVSVQREE